ncbi:MAG: helix-turn-helix domain-containing protein [Rhizomicrobium sp.]|jgi:excisionase family DNA binding protein
MKTPKKLDQSLMNVTEVAEFLRVSEKTVRRLIDAKDLPDHRIGRAIRISKGAVLGYLDRVREVSP